MVDPSTPPSTEVRAADSVWDHSAKAIEIEDIEARVAERSYVTFLPHTTSAPAPERGHEHPTEMAIHHRPSLDGGTRPFIRR